MYDPTGHVMHTPPTVGLYVPVAQSVHAEEVVLPAGLLLPAGQPVHAERDVLPAAELVPAGQFVHRPPAVALYVPDGQSVHVLVPAAEL